MEVLLAKKQSRTKGSQNRDVPVEAGKRAVVKEGKDFQKFRSGDEGLVLSVSKDGSTCQIEFDGSLFPATVATRHLNGLINGQVNGKRGTQVLLVEEETPASPPGAKTTDSTRLFVDDGKLTLARWKPKNASSEKSRPAPKGYKIIAKSSWRDDTEELDLSPERRRRRRSPAGSPAADTQFSDESCLRQTLQKCSSAMLANLRASEVFNEGHKSIPGQKEVILRVSEASFQNWQQSLAELQRAVECCSGELDPASTANPSPLQKSPSSNSIVVPVETLGFRQELDTTYRPGPLLFGTTCEAPLSSPLGLYGRSMSVPPPRNPLQNMLGPPPLLSPPYSPGREGAVLSPRFMGVTSATPSIIGSVSLSPSLSFGARNPNPAWMSQEQQATPPLLASNPHTMLGPARTTGQSHPTRNLTASPSRVITGPGNRMGTGRPSWNDAAMVARSSNMRALMGPKATNTAKAKKRSPRRKSFSEWISEEFNWGGSSSSGSDDE